MHIIVNLDILYPTHSLQQNQVLGELNTAIIKVLAVHISATEIPGHSGFLDDVIVPRLTKGNLISRVSMYIYVFINLIIKTYIYISLFTCLYIYLWSFYNHLKFMSN